MNYEISVVHRMPKPLPRLRTKVIFWIVYALAPQKLRHKGVCFSVFELLVDRSELVSRPCFLMH